jgi:hypothetical protein
MLVYIFMLCSQCILAISFNSLTNKCTFYFLTSIYPTYVSTVFWSSSGVSVTNTQQDRQQQGMDINSYTRPTANNFNFNKFEFKSDNFNNFNEVDISNDIVSCVHNL